MGPMISNPPRMVRLERYEHAVGTTGAAEHILGRLALAAAFLLVVPPVEGHLEAAQAVE
jgi:hypothetical protein